MWPASGTLTSTTRPEHSSSTFSKDPQPAGPASAERHRGQPNRTDGVIGRESNHRPPRRRRPTIDTSVFSGLKKPTFSMVVAQAPTSEFVPYLTISESYLNISEYYSLYLWLLL